MVLLLLPFLRCCIGEFDAWPSTILQLLFIDKPHPEGIKDLSAFFFGNGLSLRYASFFYDKCNEQANIIETIIMFSHYSLWYNDKQTLHQIKYYNVRQKKFMWINGRDHPQLEPVLPEESDIPLGVNGTDHIEQISGKIMNLQDREIELELLH